MPVQTPQERSELSRIGGFAKWAASDDPTIAAAAEEGRRAARARLNAMIAQRHLVTAATEYADAEQRLRDLGLVVEP